MVFRNYSKRKAIRYFKKLDVQKLVSLSDSVQRFCVNETENGRNYYHHLPLKSTKCLALDIDNWDLSSNDIENVKNSCRTLFQYFNNALILFKNESTDIIKEKLLPPWVVFPLYDRHSMYWHMGDGEAYEGLFADILCSLSKEEFAAYQIRYPIPAYMDETGEGYKLYRYIPQDV